MSFEEHIAAVIRAAVREAVAPLEAEVARLREERSRSGVSETEAARRLGVSVRTVQRRVKDGTIAAVRVGGATRVVLSGVLPAPAQE